MRLFFENIQQGMEKNVALQRAKQSYLKQFDYQHPYYWGSFVLVGDDAAIGPLSGQGGSHFPSRIMGMFLLFITLALLFLIVRKRK